VSERPERRENDEERAQGSLEEFREEARVKYGDGEERAGLALSEKHEAVPEQARKEPIEHEGELDMASAEGKTDGDRLPENTDSQRHIGEERTVDSQRLPESESQTESSPDSTRVGNNNTTEGMQEARSQASPDSESKETREGASGEVGEAVQEHSPAVPIQEPATNDCEPVELESKANRPQSLSPEELMSEISELSEGISNRGGRPAGFGEAEAARESQTAAAEQEPNTSEGFSGESEPKVITDPHNPGRDSDIVNLGASGLKADEPDISQEAKDLGIVSLEGANQVGSSEQPLTEPSKVRKEGSGSVPQPNRLESNNPLTRKEADWQQTDCPNVQEARNWLSKSAINEKCSTENDVAFKASGYGRSCAILIPERMIPDHHERRDVFEVTVARTSEPEKEYKLYLTHKPGYDRAYVDLFQLNPTRGEMFNAKPPKAFNLSSIVDAYNCMSSRGLENTRLVEQTGSLALKVESKSLRLDNPKLTVHQGRVVLNSELEEVGGTRLVKEIDGFRLRLKDHSLVTSIKIHEGGLGFEYRRTLSEPFPHIRLVQRESLIAVGETRKEHSCRIEEAGVSTERPLSLASSLVRVEFSSANQESAWRYWSSAATYRERLHHIGDIGESVAETALGNSGFKVFEKEYYGYALFSGLHRSERSGPDVICEKDESFYVAQVKHWRDPQEGLNAAIKDVARFEHNRLQRNRLEERLGAQIRGGMAIEICWSYKERRGIIYTDYLGFGST